MLGSQSPILVTLYNTDLDTEDLYSFQLRVPEGVILHFYRTRMQKIFLHILSIRQIVSLNIEVFS